MLRKIGLVIAIFVTGFMLSAFAALAIGIAMSYA